MAGPLTGYRIIELAGIGPGPFGAMLLSDMGADIVRIDRAERASGDASAPTPYYDVMGRGRRSIGVDLKNPDGVETVLKLVEHADALIEGFRPGVTERLGLGPDVCLARNPKLVYGRMTGWGQDGPYAARSGHDINYIALAGCLAHIGTSTGRPCRRSTSSATSAAAGCSWRSASCARSSKRSESGKGQVVDAAMVDGAAILMSMFHGFCAIGIWNDERGTNVLDTGAPFYDMYETRRRQVRLARVARAAVLRRAHAHHGSRRRSRLRQADGSSRLASAEAAPARGLHHEDPRRVVRDPGAHRRVLRARAHRWRSA